MTSSQYVPVFETRRGAIRESVHFGAVAVVDWRGNLVASLGNPHLVTFLRSTAKPFQALAFIEQDGHRYWQLTQKEIAIMCASHAGTADQVATVGGIQKKVGINESALKCGVHKPKDEAAAEALLARGENPTPNYHNCSGKHTGMLAFARMQHHSLGDYLDPEHPIQRQILETLSDMCVLEPEDVILGTDGCSVPNFAIPLFHAAWGMARLCNPQELAPGRAAACQVITDAINAYPEMISGPGRFDTRLIQVGAGRLIAKGGAEGYMGVGLMPGVLESHSSGLGIAFKISDGDGKSRAHPAVALEVLRQLNIFSAVDFEKLCSFGPQIPIKNQRELVVGKGRPVFSLHMHPARKKPHQ